MKRRLGFLIGDDGKQRAAAKHDEIFRVHRTRLRVGDWRVVFQENADEMNILDIGPRGSIY